MNLKEVRDQLLRDSGLYNTSPDTDVIESYNNRINAAYIGLAAIGRWYFWFNTININVPAGKESVSLPSDFSALHSVRDGDGNEVQMKTFEHQQKYKVRLNSMRAKYTVSLGPSLRYCYFSDGAVSISRGSDIVTLTISTWPADVVGRAFGVNGDEESFIIVERISDTQVRLDHERTLSSVSSSAFRVDPVKTKTLNVIPVPDSDMQFSINYFYRPAKLIANSDEINMPEEFCDYLIQAARVDILHGEEERQTLWNQAISRREEIIADMKRKNVTLCGKILSIRGVCA